MFNAVEQFSKEIDVLSKDNQALKDEVNRLKGEQGKPNPCAQTNNKNNNHSTREKQILWMRVSHPPKRHRCQLKLEAHIPVNLRGYAIVLFKEKAIRRSWHNEEWWFSVSDIVAVLTDSANPTDYIKKIRSRDKALAQGWGQIVTPLVLETQGGKQRINCANTDLKVRLE